MLSTSYSASLLLINVFIWLVMLKIAWPAIHQAPLSCSPPKKQLRLFYVLFISYCVFAFAEHDTYHMWDNFKLNYGLEHFEPTYLWLIDHVTGLNYFLWRSIVWGIACGSIILACKMLKVESYSSFLAITMLLPVSYFVATRGASGHTLTVLAMLMILGGENLYKRNILFGIALLYVSFFLHRSNIIMIAFTLAVGLYPFKISRKFVIISLVLFPILVGITTTFLNDFINGIFKVGMGDNMDMQGKAMSYATREASEFSIVGHITNIIEKAPVVFAQYLITRRITFENIKVERPYLFLYKLTYVLLYVSFLFYFQETSIWFHERLFFMSLIPMCLVLPRVMTFSNSWMKDGRLFVLLSFLSIGFKFFYRYYIFSKLG